MQWPPTKPGINPSAFHFVFIPSTTSLVSRVTPPGRAAQLSNLRRNLKMAGWLTSFPPSGPTILPGKALRITPISFPPIPDTPGLLLSAVIRINILKKFRRQGMQLTRIMQRNLKEYTEMTLSVVLLKTDRERENYV